MWATEMGRDFLGDELPPDEINIVREDKNYGWPLCYGKRVLDLDFVDESQAKGVTCANTEPSHIDLPAHVAPLGLAFIPANSNWPEEYWGDLLVAYHGSWNRSTPIGYKVARLKLDESGAYKGAEDFITGWLTSEGALGRPVDLKFDAKGNLYISDDKAGVVYRVTPPAIR
jgi:glucose/arabinose dehydrogenase